MSKKKLLICFPLWSAKASIAIMQMLAEQAEKNVAIAIKEVDEPDAIKEGEYEDEAFDQYGESQPFMRTYYSCGACIGHEAEQVKLEYIHLTTQLTRRSAFLTIFGLFEHRMNDCLPFMKKISGYTGEIKGKGPVERVHALMRDVYGCKKIPDVDHLTKIRNIMVHNDAIANDYIKILKRTDKKSEAEKRLLSAVRRSDGITVNDFNEMLMSDIFLIYAVSEFKRYIDGLETVINIFHQQKT